MAKQSTMKKVEETSNQQIETPLHTLPEDKSPTELTTEAQKHNRVLQSYSMKDLYDQYKTHSAVIRFLHSKGFTRSEIAEATGKLYQHVRNVLVQDAQKAAAQKAQAEQSGAEDNEDAKTK